MHMKHSDDKTELRHKCLWGLTVICLLIFSQDTFYEISEARQLKLWSVTPKSMDSKFGPGCFSIMSTTLLKKDQKLEDLRMSMKLRHVSSRI